MIAVLSLLKRLSCINMVDIIILLLLSAILPNLHILIKFYHFPFSLLIFYAPAKFHREIFRNKEKVGLRG